MNRPANQKCGNCKHFQVRNQTEIELARIAKNESECAPGEWVFEGKRNVGCHGGPVQGLCSKWRERKAQGPAMMSTQWCNLWAEGGPVLRQAGSLNAATENPENPENRAKPSKHSNVDGAMLTIGVLSVISAIAAWRNQR